MGPLHARAPHATVLPDPGRWGAAALIGALALTLALAFALAAVAPSAAPLYLVAVAGVAVLLALSQLPLGLLTGLLLLFSAMSGYNPGLQPEEVVFAVFFLTYMVGWYTRRIFAYRERLVAGLADVMIAFLLIYTTCTVGLSFLYGAKPAEAIGEWMNMAMLAFYFPLREACVRYRWAPRLVIALLVLFGMIALTRNLISLQHRIANAEFAYQIARGRVAENEMLMFVPGVACLTLALFDAKWWRRIGLLALASALTAGVILSQSRSYVVGLAIMFAALIGLLDWRRKVKLFALTTVGAAALTAFALAFYGDFVTLIAFGLLDRLLSIGTATHHDISYASRVVEARAVWKYILQNPVLGYGPGVPYTYYDIIAQREYTKTYSHNAYLILWFKYGLVGLSAFMLAWAGALWKTVRTIYLGAEASERAVALFAATCLISLILPNLVNAAFSTADTVLMFTMIFALADAADARARKGHTYHEPA